MKVHDHITDICRRSFFKIRQFHLAFSCNDADFQVEIFKTYIRPLLEYNTPIWSPYLLSDIDNVERVQRVFTKRIPGLWNTPYLERLQILNLKSLESRRIVNDLILLYKMVNHLIDLNNSDFFTFNQSTTRGHSAKINHEYSRLDIRKYFFTNRTVTIWNALPQSIIDSSSLQMFKSKINEYNLEIYCRGHAHTAAQ